MSKYQELSKEELLKLVEKQELEIKIKKYGLVWDNEKYPEQVVLDCENNIPILKRVKEKEIKTDNGDNNILIEGDNYHALTCLNYTHKGKIDVIYIDPPYNTGNKSWKYNNDYVEKDDVYIHSKWLNMMSKRLELAKNLLKPDGALICAIDENEVNNLGILLRKIFFNYNIDCIAVMHNPGGIQGTNFSYNHEYAFFVYPLKSYYIKPENRDGSDITPFRDWGKENSKRQGSPNCFYPIISDGEKIIGFGDVPKDNYNPNSSNILRKDGLIEVWPIDGNKVERRWRFARDSVNEIENELLVKRDSNGIISIVRAKIGYTRKTIWNDAKFNANIYGTQLLSQIIKEKFPFPKSLYLVKECISSVLQNNKDSIILDFFAGSGTTGHAVLELNKEDGGNRKFILCTNNESNICEEITYPRIHNVIKGYKFKGKDKTILFEKKLTLGQLKNINSIIADVDKIIEENKIKFDEIEKKFEDSTIRITGVRNIDGFKDGLNGNLQYFKTDLIPVERIDNISDQKRHDLTEKAGQMIAIKENTFEEIETNEWYQIFVNKSKNKKTAIYFREDMQEFESLVDKLKDSNTILYVFSYGRIDKKLFKYIDKNINIEDIPEPILEIYKEINLTLKDK